MPVLTLDYRHCDRKRPKYIKHIEIEAIAALARQQLVGGGVDAIAFDTLRQIEETNQTILSVVPDHLVDPILEATYTVLGDLRTKPNAGFAFVLDVERIFGSKTLKELE